MPSRPTRLAAHAFAATALLLATSCSQNDRQADRPESGEAGDTSTPPNIAPTAAPGVAFNYNYDFSLPDERISATQEAHASACEKLGVGRCRITGMSYSVDQDEQVSASLELKLDPVIARQFGRSAQQTVEGNHGQLVRLEIGSSDEGQAIEQAQKQKGDTSAQIAQLQQELARTKAGTEAHANLLSRIQALQEQSSEQARAIEAGRAALARTPMRFDYYGRGGVPGFRGNPVREAWHTFVSTVVWLVGILLQAAAILVPLGVLAVAFIALWRTRPMRALRRWVKGASDEAES